MREFLPAGVTLRRKPNRWPPLHTPLVWERNIPNRTAMMMYHTAGGLQKPTPSVLSCTTGLANYDEWNSRAILADWTDHPQRLWDALEYSLASGAELVIHVGPDPKLLTTCFSDCPVSQDHEAIKVAAPRPPGVECDPEYWPQWLADP